MLEIRLGGEGITVRNDFNLSIRRLDIRVWCNMLSFIRSEPKITKHTQLVLLRDMYRLIVGEFMSSKGHPLFFLGLDARYSVLRT